MSQRPSMLHYPRFVFILLPLIRPALATVIVIHAIAIWNERSSPPSS